MDTPVIRIHLEKQDDNGSEAEVDEGLQEASGFDQKSSSSFHHSLFRTSVTTLHKITLWSLTLASLALCFSDSQLYKFICVISSPRSDVIIIIMVFHTQEDPPAGVSGAPGENNIMLWNAVIFGPHETPFEVANLRMFIRIPY